jgi:hypothetical protein
MSEDIKVIKLINGEDLIVEVVAEVESSYGRTHYEVINAANLVLQETEKGMTVGLAPYLPYSEGNIKLYLHTITAEASPEPHMLQEYKRVFGKIVTPSSSIIMPK